ncbi:MAG TPA: D-alanyl-D-alanine carboxypeptidase [Candidatus Fimimorpha faecalis]|uniref:D-alanyl-D-alanine carboxypeptidase n=1 Tax=Candidatus Fimimorpha faecalis TaxID=2840824 RepID=A0A9D1JC28_9FIRM|nr:D-alanyl-D-alanine carboxypeptidase [Candidatus Fimimorpha faecalis]
MKRIISSIIMVVIALSLFSNLKMEQVFAEVNGPEVNGQAYCVMDADTGEVIISKNMDARMYPASITKIMTALIAFEQCKNLDDEITFSETALDISSISSTIHPAAKVGETMSFMDVMYGLMLSSGNECANALAEYTYGDIGIFVEKMNERAQQIGAVNTHFTNPHGLHDENHYTTAKDMDLIFREALKNKDFVKVASTPTYNIPETNKEDSRYCEAGHRMVLGTIPCEGIIAGKSGRTREAGRTLMTAVERNGRTLVIALLKTNDNNLYGDTQVLIDYGFNIAEGNYPKVTWDLVQDEVWATADVKIRKYPSSYASQVGYLARGKSVERVATYDKWSRVKVGESEFYIDSDYLVTDKSMIPKETVAATSDEKKEKESSKEATKGIILETESSEEELNMPENDSPYNQVSHSSGIINQIKNNMIDYFGEDWKVVTGLGISIIIVVIILIVYLIRRNKKND